MWVRNDDMIIRHPKILAVGERGAYFYWASLIYAAQYRTDGFIPKAALPAIAPVSDYEERAHLLVTVRAPGYEHGLWEEAPGGYRIHDYLDYQPSAASLRKREQADRDRLRAARERGAVGGAGRNDAKDSHAEPTSPATDEEVEDWDAPPPLTSSMRTPTEPRRVQREPARSKRGSLGNIAGNADDEEVPASTGARRSGMGTAAEPRRNDVAARSPRSRRVPSPSPSPFPNPDRSQDPDRVSAPDPRATAREEHTHTGGGDEIIVQRSAAMPEPRDVGRPSSTDTAAKPGQGEPNHDVSDHASEERAPASGTARQRGVHAVAEPRRNEVAARSLRSRPVPSPSPSPSPDQFQDPDRVCALDPRATAREEHTHTWVGDEIVAQRSAQAPEPRVVERPPSANAAAELGQGEALPAASARPPEAAPEDDEITALQVLELLRALPAPMCHLATPENARSFAMARNLGLALPDIRSAITAAAVKVGKHRNARPEEPQTLVALAQHVGAFIVNQRPAAVAATSPRAPTDAGAVDGFLSRWRELYAQAEGVTYTVTDEDREHAAELVGLIAEAARAHAANPGVDAAGLEERIAERWMRRYLRDEGVNGYLVKVRHALRYMKRGVATYGLPQGPARPAGAAETNEPESAAPMPAAASAACGEAVLRMLAGGSGPGPLKVQRPSAAPRAAAG